MGLERWVMSDLVDCQRVERRDRSGSGNPETVPHRILQRLVNMRGCIAARHPLIEVANQKCAFRRSRQYRSQRREIGFMILPCLAIAAAGINMRRAQIGSASGRERVCQYV